MQYNWSKYNLLDRLDELERLKKSAKRKERIIINQNIDFLKDNIDEFQTWWMKVVPPLSSDRQCKIHLIAGTP